MIYNLHWKCFCIINLYVHIKDLQFENDVHVQIYIPNRDLFNIGVRIYVNITRGGISGIYYQLNMVYNYDLTIQFLIMCICKSRNINSILYTPNYNPCISNIMQCMCFFGFFLYDVST